MLSTFASLSVNSAKHLPTPLHRPFASLRVTWQDIPGRALNKVYYINCYQVLSKTPVSKETAYNTEWLRFVTSIIELLLFLNQIITTSLFADLHVASIIEMQFILFHPGKRCG